MANTWNEPRKPLARSIAAYSDAELDTFLQESMRKHGVQLIDVEDPENLSETFINRLKDRSTAHTWSKAVDLDQVAARLLTIPNDTDTSRRAGSPTPTEPLPPDDFYERRAYDNLIRTGGRPCYPIEMLEDVMADPKAFSEMLHPWVYYTDAIPPQWDVFEAQWNSWGLFRRWQQFFRGNFGDWDRSIPDLQRLYNSFARCASPGFSGYVEADKLSTWIEYLAFAYYFHDEYARSVIRQQSTFDEAWKKLEASVDLEPFETQEYVVSTESSLDREAKRRKAQKAVITAQSELEKLMASVPNLNSPDLRLEPLKCRQLEAAAKQLQETRATLKAVRTRSEHFTTFHITRGSHKIAKHKEELHQRHLQWILKQVPVVEAEICQSISATPGPPAVPGTKRKSMHNGETDADAVHPRTRGAKKQRLQAQENAAQMFALDSHVACPVPLPPSTVPQAGEEQPMPQEPLCRSSRRSRPTVTTEFRPIPGRRTISIVDGERRSRRLAGKPPECGPLP
ncbi:hypothetical protein EV127DRAFT_474153 [Xylaria flabelliformis]|nr:hypothetical protein EV127DRAFT_474153 [Xylaria flabelliformis]